MGVSIALVGEVHLCQVVPEACRSAVLHLQVMLLSPYLVPSIVLVNCHVCRHSITGRLIMTAEGGNTHIVDNLLLQLQLIACELVPELCLPVCKLLRHILQAAAQGSILSLHAAHRQDTCYNALYTDDKPKAFESRVQNQLIERDKGTLLCNIS